MKTDIILFLTGIVGGAINAVAGGGGILMFPALLAAGLPPLTANATASLAVRPGAFSSVYAYRKHLRKVPSYYLLLLIPTTVGAIIGSLLLIHTSHNIFDKLAPWLVLLAVSLLAVQPIVKHRVMSGSGKQIHRHPVRVLFVIGLFIFPLAIYGGYFGVGYGIMVLAFLAFSNLKNIYQMTAVKNLSGGVIAFIATLYFASNSLIDWRTGLFMAAGTVTGGLLGARFALRTPVKTVYNGTVLIGAVIAIILLAKEYL